MNFEQHLLSILRESTSRLRPAVVKTARGVTIHADHARWIRGNGGHVFLAIGISPGEYQTRPRYNCRGAKNSPLAHERDFYLPKKWEPARWQDASGWDEPICQNCKKNPCECGNPLPGFNAHRQAVRRCRFKKIITIQRENVKSVTWV
jgi:hypothetical protein